MDGFCAFCDLLSHDHEHVGQAIDHVEQSAAAGVKLDPELGCFRARLDIASHLYDLTGENSDAVPRKAVSEIEGGPIVALVPFDAPPCAR